MYHIVSKYNQYLTDKLYFASNTNNAALWSIVNIDTHVKNNDTIMLVCKNNNNNYNKAIFINDDGLVSLENIDELNIIITDGTTNNHNLSFDKPVFFLSKDRSLVLRHISTHNNLIFAKYKQLDSTCSSFFLSDIELNKSHKIQTSKPHVKQNYSHREYENQNYPYQEYETQNLLQQISSNTYDKYQHVVVLILLMLLLILIMLLSNDTSLRFLGL